MELYDTTVPLFLKQLRTLDRWLDKAVAHAKLKKFDPEILLASRLAPDQFALVRQVQSACDAMKFAAARLAAKTPPANPDTEKTIDELRARMRATAAFLETIGRDDFAGAADRPCSAAWMQGRTMRGEDYLVHFALPNLYFHLVTTYAILRHNGVELGKMDYIGDVPFAS